MIGQQICAVIRLWDGQIFNFLQLFIEFLKILRVLLSACSLVLVANH